MENDVNHANAIDNVGSSNNSINGKDGSYMCCDDDNSSADVCDEDVMHGLVEIPVFDVKVKINCFNVCININVTIKAVGK